MADLFLKMGVFLLIAAAVAAVCFWMVRRDEKKSAR